MSVCVYIYFYEGYNLSKGQTDRQIHASLTVYTHSLKGIYKDRHMNG